MSKTIVKWAHWALALGVSLPVLGAAPALAAPAICISTRDIQDQTVENRGKAIVFKMRNGTLWRNTLRGACPDLIFNGFIWTVRNPGERVCENEQSLRVLQSGQVCMLGKFEKLPPAKP